MKIECYHGTHSLAKQSIEQYGFDPDRTHRRADHWLGQGVYFFMDLDQALWWAGNACRQHPGSSPVVYKAEIEVPDEKFLNLDDNRQNALYQERMIDAVTRQYPDGNYPMFNKDTMRAIFLDYYKQKYGFSVIKYTFVKDCVKYAGYLQHKERLALQKKLVQMLGLYFKETQICVSDGSCIVRTEIVYDRENEVI